MAWNRPSAANQQPAQKSGSKAPSKMRGVIAGAVVVVLGALCFFIFSGKETRQDTASTKERGKIKEVTPAAAPTNAVPAKKAKPVRPPEVKQDENGVWRYPGGLRWLDPNRKVSRIDHRCKEVKMFKHYSEAHIAILLQIEPGTSIVGDADYPPDIGKDFLESLNEPYVYDKEESREDRELRIAVEQTKKDLKKRVEAGEDIAKILKDYRDELRRLGAFKEEINSLVNEKFTDENVSDEDAKLFVSAANEMLAKEGLPPMKEPNMLFRHGVLKRARAIAEAEAQKASSQDKEVR